MTEEFRGERPAGPRGQRVPFRIARETGKGAEFTCDGWRMTRYRHHLTGRQLMVKSARAGTDPAGLRQEFDNTAALVRLLGRDHVPRQLAHVLARDDSAPNGPRLLLDWRGRRLSGWPSPDPLHSKLEGAVRDLFAAVSTLHLCGLVHGRLDLEHLWWDGDGLQLSGLDTSVRRGETPPARARTVWDPPDFGHGRAADEQDDVHSAALLAFWMATGETVPQGTTRGQLRDLVDPHEAWIRDLMLRIFSDTGPAQNPPRLPGAAEVREWLDPQPLRGQRLLLQRRDHELERLMLDARKDFAQLRDRQRALREQRRRREQAAEWERTERLRRAAEAAARAEEAAAAPPPGPSPAPPVRTRGLRGLLSRLLAPPPEPVVPPPPRPRRAPESKPPPPRPSRVECPVCLNDLDWDSLPRGEYDKLHLPAQREDPDEEPRRPPAAAGERARMAQEARSFRTCPGNDHITPHAIPERYPSYGTPVRIGLIGATDTGKSHLLAVMIHQVMDAGVAHQYGLEVQPLDLRQYNEYRAATVDRLMKERRELAVTSETASVHFAVGLIVTDLASGLRHTVVFFDIAGERLQRSGPEVDFLGGLNALLCVVDPRTVPGLRKLGRPASGQGEDRAVAAVRTRLKAQKRPTDGHLLPLPCALVVTKSDLLRHLRLTEAEPWLPGGTGSDADLTSVERESEDVYAMLWARGGRRALDLVRECEDATLHLASATGTHSEPDDNGEPRFGDGFGQHRVLAPLLSLLVMKGVLTGPAARLGLHRDDPPPEGRT
ncbi:hypothetical protein [Streptomyces sp. NPDC048191]|uniref:hypothetical protein n=1 Tax=Streptomyces sp. NPDC048191 TaxID=3155484 RepID=UPI0033C6B1D7